MDPIIGDNDDNVLNGTDQADLLQGLGGDDTLTGNKGDDTVEGGDGDDLMIWNNGDGSDLMEGGAGNDTVQVNAADAAGDEFTVTENAGRVDFTRTNLGQFSLDIGTTELLDVNGQGGDDTIDATGLAAGLISLDFDGGDGNDTLIGGDGIDLLKGGAGDDTITGGKGDDDIQGGDGDDLMIWNNGDGSDTMEGGAGNDTVQVNAADGAGDEFTVTENAGRVDFARTNLGLFSLDIGTTETLDVNGQGGDDVIDATGLNAGLISLAFNGGAGDDLVKGGDGDDLLEGGSGNDTIIGGKGNDDVRGGNGDDLMIWNNGDGSDTFEGGSQNDTVQVNAADGAGDEFVVTENAGRVEFARTNLGLFSLDIGTTETLDVNGQGGDDIIDASGLAAGLISLAFDGGAGNDLMMGGDGDDLLEGGEGDDTLIGNGGDDVLIGDTGNDDVQGGDGDDLLIWNNGDGSDTMEGGDGDDTVQVNAADGAGDEFVITENAGRVEFARTNLGLFQLDIGTAETLEVNGQGGDDVVDGSALTSGLIALDLDGGEGDDLLIGGNLADTLRGGDGNDALVGGDGDDTLNGQNGNDTLNGGAGADSLNGGNETDLVSYADATTGVTASLADPSVNTGDAAGDTYTSIEGFIGTDFDDTLTGNNNNNTLSGGDGIDVLNGESGNDILIGGAGADILNGGDRSDLADYSDSDAGVIVELDGVGNAVGIGGHAEGDQLTSVENLIGSAFDDVLSSNSSKINLVGGAGNDMLTASNRNRDNLTGGTGDDVLNGQGGGDGNGIGDFAFYSGASTDYLVGLTETANVFRVVDLRNGAENEGIDTLLNIEHLRFSDVDFLIGDRIDDTLLLGTNDADTLTADIGAVLINGFDGDDVITANGLDNTVFGGEGDDILDGGAGSDELDGGAGTDTASYGSAAAGVQASLQDATVNTGDASGDTFNSIENLSGSDFNDVLRGNGSNNTLSGGDGDDVLRGGAGADALDGNGGIDQADYADAGPGLVVDLQNANNNTGDAAGDTFTDIENLRGSRNDDSLRGDAGDNEIFGLGGNDFIVGRDGNDTLNGSGGDDTLRGGEGADALIGGAGIDVADYSDISDGLVLDLQIASNNTGQAAGDTYDGVENLTATNGDDNLRGDAGNNVITARGGDDFLSGRDGDDVLIGSAGDDILRGGEGADRLVGGSGIDTADYRDVDEGLLADFQFSANNTGGALGDTYVTVENLFGTSGDDSLRGNGEDNLIVAGQGDDFLVGRNGSDTLVGNSGNDILRGGRDADVLDGGNGQDRADYSDATFNVRADLANSAANVGAHALGDTYISIEDIRGSNGFKDDLRGDDGDNVLEGLGGDDILTGRGGNDTLQGSVGDDVLTGGAGDDILIGGAGADTFIFNAPTEGVDSMIGFAINSDVIHLDDAGFTALSAGAVAADNFHFGAAALDANDFLIYDGTTLFYDADGNGAGEQVALATFNNSAALDENDFLII